MVLTSPSEEQEQRTVADYLDWLNIVWCHPPNGGKRSKSEAARFQLIGVKPGVPDILIFSQPPKLPNVRGVWIEMKKVRGPKPTESQSQWHSDLGECNWVGRVCYGAEDALTFIKSLGW